MFFNVKLPYTVVNIILNAIPVYIGFRFIGKKFTLFSCWVILLAGFLVDSYYAGILGIYMGIFAVIVRVIRLVRTNILQNPFTLGLALIFLLTITETGVYIIYTLIGIQHLTVQQFLVQRLASSLILNIVLYYVLYIPLKKFALWVQAGISHEKISLRATRRNQGNSYHYH